MVSAPRQFVGRTNLVFLSVTVEGVPNTPGGVDPAQLQEMAAYTTKNSRELGFNPYKVTGTFDSGTLPPGAPAGHVPQVTVPLNNPAVIAAAQLGATFVFQGGTYSIDYVTCERYTRGIRLS